MALGIIIYTHKVLHAIYITGVNAEPIYVKLYGETGVIGGFRGVSEVSGNPLPD